SIFVVRLDNDVPRMVTYSYSDVLTKTVQLYFAL
ncbi:MAG: Veg family protein, partial [Bacilli bacterium]